MALGKTSLFTLAPWSAAAVSARSRVALAIEERERVIQATPPEVLARQEAEAAAEHEALFVDQCLVAWEWMSTLGSPATLVGGAALASFFELRNHLSPVETDSRRIQIGKSLVLIMLIMAFASEIACVFLGTITGDQLMANSDVPAPAPFGMLDGGGGRWGRGTGRINCMAASPMGMMHRELEFEFLASRVGFFQGILLWLGALSVELALTADAINWRTAGRVMVQRRRLLFAASLSTLALLVWMVAFFNWHLPFYKNYWEILKHLAYVTWTRYVWHLGPPRFTALVVLAPLGASVWFLVGALVM